MKICCQQVAASLVIGLTVVSADEYLPKFYHTSDEVLDELYRLSKECRGFSLAKNSLGGGNSIEIVTIEPTAELHHRFFLLSGEHARELITTESALHFVRALCGEIPELQEKAARALRHTKFQVIVNGNPISRKKVEKGEYCLRVNENHVDLNRNWKDHWESLSNSPETFPGSAPFSELETQIFRDAVVEFRPHTFLSIHSGTLGMYMPWAYQSSEPRRNEKIMQEILSDVDEKFCRCPFGSAAAHVGYRSSGTCLDYVYGELSTPFAFAFEIYAEPSSRNELFRQWRREAALARLASSTSDEHLRRHVWKSRQQILLAEPMYITDECFSQFNPATIDDYRETVTNWTKAYLRLNMLCHERVHELHR